MWGLTADGEQKGRTAWQKDVKRKGCSPGIPTLLSCSLFTCCRDMDLLPLATFSGTPKTRVRVESSHSRCLASCGVAPMCVILQTPQAGRPGGCEVWSVEGRRGWTMTAWCLPPHAISLRSKINPPQPSFRRQRRSVRTTATGSKCPAGRGAQGRDGTRVKRDARDERAYRGRAANQRTARSTSRAVSSYREDRTNVRVLQANARAMPDFPRMLGMVSWEWRARIKDGSRRRA